MLISLIVQDHHQVQQPLLLPQKHEFYSDFHGTLFQGLHATLISYPFDLELMIGN